MDRANESLVAEATDIPALEKSLNEGDFDSAARRVKNLIEVLGTDGAHVDLGTEDEQQIRAAFGQVVRAIARLICAPDFNPPDDFFRSLACRKRVVLDLFGASDLDRIDRMLEAIVAQLRAGDLPGYQALQKLLLGYSLDSDVEFDPIEHLEHAPSQVIDTVLGLAATNVVLDDRTLEGRKRLAPMLEAISGHAIPFESLKYLAQGWFRCSYDDWRDKHAIKRSMNGVVRNTLRSAGVNSAPMPKRRLNSDRPTIAIPVERFTATHAVYRCWAPAVRQLRDRFRLVAVCEPDRIDDKSAELFDDVLTFEFNESGFAQVVSELQAVGPDILYYPSVGMSAAVIALANLRIAPIQVMTVGHPATSMSDVMDYVVVEKPWLGDPSCFSETIVLLSEGAFQSELRYDATPVPPKIRDHANPVLVAVSGTFFKLNPRFLYVCREIVERSQRPVEFHFFPSTLGPRHYHVSRRVREVVPGSVVHLSSGFNEYIGNLNRCDIQLVPFPFGNTNSSLDGFRQGLPVITLDGEEVHSRIDSAMLHALELPEWLVASNVEEFVAAAVRLAENDSERIAVSKQMLETDLDGRFFDSNYLRQPRDFVELFRWLYECHEVIQDDGRKVWTPYCRSEAYAENRLDEVAGGNRHLQASGTLGALR